MGSDCLSRCAGAALAYAEHGWPVLPGSAWDGRHWLVAGRVAPVGELRPTVPRTDASTDPDRVAAWWMVTGPVTPSVLLRSGSSFEAVAVRAGLAYRVLRWLREHDAAGPVAYRPDIATAYVLVQRDIPDPVLPRDRAGVLPAGSWIPAPPTPVPGGVMRWWVDPVTVGWRPVALSVLAAALTARSPVNAR